MCAPNIALFSFKEFVKRNKTYEKTFRTLAIENLYFAKKNIQSFDENEHSFAFSGEKLLNLSWFK